MKCMCEGDGEGREGISTVGIWKNEYGMIVMY